MRLWHKITLALVLLALIPLAVATYTLVSRGADQLEVGAKNYHLAIADVALGVIRRTIDQAFVEAHTVGAALAQKGPSLDERMRAARAQLIGAKEVDNLSVYGPDGALIDTMRAPREGQDAQHDAPEQLPADLLKIARNEGQITMGIVRRSDDAPLLPLLAPIYRGDPPELYAYVYSELDLMPLSAAVGDLSARRFGERRDFVRLLDEQLRIIAADDAKQLWTSMAGTGAASGIDTTTASFKHNVARAIDYDRKDGERVVGAIVPLIELGWGVVVEQKYSEAYKAVSETWKTALTVGSIFGLIAILLGFLVGRRLARPVVQVADAAKQVAAGDFDVRVKVQSSDEVGQMGVAFNEMAKDLGDYRQQLIEETRVRSDMSRYLSPEIVEGVIEGSQAMVLGGERRIVTVLFADVVSFTSLADEHEPEFVVSILNELFTIITEIVFKHGGIIDKFIGDCAMALFGAPKKHEDDAQRAVRAAEEILRWLEVGNAKWRKQLGRDIELAIGVNTGVAVVGNVGSEKRMEYTAIGDMVNVAARLERLARPGQILMTREVMDAVSDEFDSLSLGKHNIVGRSRPSEIFVLDE